MSPELEKMARRAALPISVSYDSFYSSDPYPIVISTPDGWIRAYATEAKASRAYLALCAELDPGTTSPGTCDRSSGSLSPEGTS